MEMIKERMEEEKKKGKEKKGKQLTWIPRESP